VRGVRAVRRWAVANSAECVIKLMDMSELTIELDDVTLKAFTYGSKDAPLALCLHGFPDSAYTFRQLAPYLAETRVPRGGALPSCYAPSSLSKSDNYQLITLAHDASTLHERLDGDGECAHRRTRLGRERRVRSDERRARAMAPRHHHGGASAGALRRGPLDVQSTSIELVHVLLSKTRRPRAWSNVTTWSFSSDCGVRGHRTNAPDEDMSTFASHWVLMSVYARPWATTERCSTPDRSSTRRCKSSPTRPCHFGAAHAHLHGAKDGCIAPVDSAKVLAVLGADSRYELLETPAISCTSSSRAPCTVLSTISSITSHGQ